MLLLLKIWRFCFRRVRTGRDHKGAVAYFVLVVWSLFKSNLLSIIFLCHVLLIGSSIVNAIYLDTVASPYANE